MESRNDKIVRLFGLIATNGNQLNDLKLEQLLKIAGQPDINIEIDHDNIVAVNQTAANVTRVSDGPTTQRTKDAPGTSVNSLRQTNVTTRSCGCKGENGCGLQINIFDALFGTHLNVKLTPWFAGYIYYVSQDNHRNGSNALRLLTLLGAQQTDMDILLARGCSIEAGKDDGTELRGLVRLLLAQALALNNHSFPDWPFRFGTNGRGVVALVAWHGRWMASSGRESQETLQLDQELLRYAFTDKPHYDCYYSFCAHKWASKSSNSHCEACKQCFFGDLAFHNAEIHERGSDKD